LDGDLEKLRVVCFSIKVDWNNVLLTVERAVHDRLEMPIVKADVHAPIFCFPKFNMPEWRKDDSLWVSNVETYLIRSGAVTEKDCVKVTNPSSGTVLV
jgi:hypothetical protein